MHISFESNDQRKSFYRFGQHDRIDIDGVEYRNPIYNEAGWYFEKCDGNGSGVHIHHDELQSISNRGRLRHYRDYFCPQARAHKEGRQLIAAITGKRAGVLGKRVSYLEARSGLWRSGVPMTDASLREKKAELQFAAIEVANGKIVRHKEQSLDLTRPPSPRTLRRWAKIEREQGVAALVGGFARRGRSNRVMAVEAVALMMENVRGYLSSNRPTKKVTYDNVCSAFSDANEKRLAQGLPIYSIPSRETVRRAIADLDKYSVVAAREGEDAARKRFRGVYDGLSEGLERPGQRVEIDEHTVDLVTLMASSGLLKYLSEEELRVFGLDNQKGRWTLTLAQCSVTRCILGISLSRNAKASAALNVLQMIMTDKGALVAAVGSTGHWNMHLKPESIFVDNGAAFRSNQFRMACADLGCTIGYTMAGVPEQRGRIERLFRTLATGLMPRLAGRTFSDVVSKGDADPEARAALTVEDFCQALTRWIVDIYHNTPHGGLGGRTPLEVWRELEKKFGTNPPPSNREWRVVFGTDFERRLTKSGLWVLNVQYNSHALEEHLRSHGEVLMTVRWHPRDIGAIEVLIGEDWVEVPSVIRAIDGTTAYAWQTAWRQLRSASKAAREYSEATVMKALREIEAINARAMAMQGVLVDEWDEARIRRAEANLGNSRLKVSEVQTQQSESGLGWSLAPPVHTRGTKPSGSGGSNARHTRPTFED